MLAVSDSKYYVPYRDPNAESESWMVQRRDSDEMIITRNLSYTIDARVLGDDVKRITFEYRGSSVKAAPRTLRFLGADLVSGFTAKLANVKEPGHRIKFVKTDRGVGWKLCKSESTGIVFGKR